MAQHFQIDEMQAKAYTLKKMSKSAVTQSERKSLAESAVQLCDSYAEQDNFIAALALIEIAMDSARKSRDSQLIRDVRAKKDDVSTMQSLYADVKQAVAALEIDPTDAKSNSVVGKYRCLAKGEWDEGLPMLALGYDEALTALATRELMGAKVSHEQVALADGWYDLAQKYEGTNKDRMLQRAGFWYQLSLKSNPALSRLVTVKVEKRMEQLDSELEDLAPNNRSAPPPLAGNSLAAELPNPLPDPDGKAADMSKPVQVYILLGQSNMVGAGKIGPADKDGSLEHAVKKKGKYPYLVDDAGNWTERKDVRNVRVMGSGTGAMNLFNNEWMTIEGRSIGPEFGIGHYVGYASDAPVLIVKSCIGNRSLGWDLLPPGSKEYEFDDQGKTWVYAGYKQSPMRWEKGTEPKPIGWYAGMQYDGDIANVKQVLSELDKYYPGAKSYGIAGFFFWQGDKDRYDAGLAGHYEENLIHFIEQLRKDFDAPKAKFVCATLGQTEKGATGNEGLILEAQLAVDGKSGKYPQFKGNVATVYSKPLCHGGASNSHYGGNAETYMDVGEAMGQAMVELLKADSK